MQKTCQVTEDHLYAKDVIETSNIKKIVDEFGNICVEANGEKLDPESYVSMNMWGFPAKSNCAPAFMKTLESEFNNFFKEVVPANPQTVEYLLPHLIGKMLREKKCTVKILETKDRWFRVTYKEDRTIVTKCFQDLIKEGVYKEKLYDGIATVRGVEMANRKKLILIQDGEHKGFYNDEDFTKALQNIRYEEFKKKPDDEEFPYDSAHPLLRGSCNIFAVALKNVLDYNVYIIQGNDRKGFHAFGQIYKDWKWYYVDARGITSSFDEFTSVASEFVHDEYTIRLVTEDDLKDWEAANYYNEGLMFAEAFIKKYKDCYTL